MRLPPAFLLGPEDELEITVWGNKDLTRVTAVRPDGLISMPIIGDVQAAGLTADALAQRIADRLKQYIANSCGVCQRKGTEQLLCIRLGGSLKTRKVPAQILRHSASSHLHGRRLYGVGQEKQIAGGTGHSEWRPQAARGAYSHSVR